jgi:CheY-specific phosphatase CheX
MNNPQTQTLDIRQVLTEHAVEVFKTMLSLQVAPSPEQAMPGFDERVTGSVGLGGENVTGAVYLHLSAALARRLAAAMLGLSTEELGEHEVNDVVGEITNMLAGHLKSCLCDAGTACAVSTPAIIRGTAYEIEAPDEVRREVLVFLCDPEPFAVEVHIKFN